jgi:hypothetical protein
MGADSGFRPSVAGFWVVLVCCACKACDQKLTALWAGASSGRPAGGKRASAKGPAQGGRRDRREYGGAATAATGSVRYVPAPGLGGCSRNSWGRREPMPPPAHVGRAASPAARSLAAFCRYGFVPLSLT